jgi:hypothetical protein
MKRVFATLIIAVIVLNSAQASIVDQVQEQIDDVWGTLCAEWHWAQTFMPGITGRLESIDINLRNIRDLALPGSGPPSYPLTISIVNTIESKPCGTVLGEVYVEELINGFNNIKFLSKSVFLTTGTQYGIVVSNDDPNAFDDGSDAWGLAYNDTYGGGSLWFWMEGVGWNQDYFKLDYDPAKMDAAFRTYMLPEPSAVLLLGMGSLAILKKRKS